MRLSDRARDELLDVYAGCLAQRGEGDDHEARRADIPLTAEALLVRRTPGQDTTLHCATGRMTFADCVLALTDASRSHSSSGGEPDRRRTEGVAQ